MNEAIQFSIYGLIAHAHTLLWVSTQIVAGYSVLIPASIVFASREMSELMMIPVLVHGIGDGLAGAASLLAIKSWL